MRIQAVLTLSFLALAFLGLILGLRRSLPLSKMPGMAAKAGGASVLGLGLAVAPLLWPGMPGGLRLGALVVMALSLVFSAAIAGFAAAIGWADRPRGRRSEVLGGQGGEGYIALVCHSGLSGFCWRANRGLGRKLGERGWRAVLYPANAERPQEGDGLLAIVYGSSILFGEPRPALLAAVEKNRGLGLPVFALFTGGIEATKEEEAAAFSAFAEARGQPVLGSRKLLSFDAAPKIEEELAAFADEISARIRLERA